jgi:hypothetical protein
LRGSRTLAAGLLALGLSAGVGPGTTPSPAAASPIDDRLLPAVQHTSDKGKTLATKHVRAMRELAAEVYHCMPWLEIHKSSIGFFKPRNTAGDQRFLSIRLYIEQEPSPQFARLTTEQRASAMFSRYVGPMLKRMTRNPSILNDDAIDGFTVILEWLKQAPQAAGQRPVHETIAVFIDKVDVDTYLAGRSSVPELAARARILGFDGETALGPLKLSAWDDDFVATFKMKNYQLAPGVTCSN